MTLRAGRHRHRPGGAARGLRRGVPRRRRPARQAGLHPGRLGGQGGRRGHACCTTSRRGSGRCSGGGSRCTAAATPPSTPPGPRSGWAPRRRSSSTGAPRTGCRPTQSELEEAEEEGVLVKWLTTIKQVEAGTLVVERMELDENGFPQPTGRARGAGRGRAGARPRPGHRPVVARRGPRPGGPRRRRGRSTQPDAHRLRGCLRRW